jgi:L-lysine 2,3-aminomutase
MYLHHADWTPGTFHFRTSVARGQSILRELRGRLPGAATPHYVLDLPRGQGKASLLDPAIRVIDELRQGPIQGAVYELQSPQTRTGRGTPLYLDLFAV